MSFPTDYFEMMAPRMQSAFRAMTDLERGAFANPDEHSMVGHYWLRTPVLAPSLEIRREIEQTVVDLKSFASGVHEGGVRGAHARFRHLLLIGIGGSAQGPQYISKALANPKTDRAGCLFFR
jgi:glucose-6-phosphate isomerase